MAARKPFIKISHNTYRLGVGRPYREIGSLLPARNTRVSAQFLITVKMSAFIEKMQIKGSNADIFQGNRSGTNGSSLGGKRLLLFQRSGLFLYHKNPEIR